MNKTPTYEELLVENAALKAESNALKANEVSLRSRIAYLERMLYGAKSDRLMSQVPSSQPGLFDELFNEAMDEKALQIEQMAKEIEKEGCRRREKNRKSSSRPARYRYHGLEERLTTLMPEGIDVQECDIIGKDITRILHREPAKVWVEVIERPILRAKADKDMPNPRIYQAKVPEAVIGGNHVGADMLAQIIIDKYRYHLPEYRQVKQYADLGVKLPTSTVNDWVHAVASRVEPVYEALRADILQSDYLQADEVPWRIADKPGNSRKGYAWQFLDSRPQGHGLYFLYMNGSRAGTVPRAELRNFKGAIQTDGYGVYDYFELQENVTLLGCMTHVRRKFTDAQKSHPRLSAQAVKWMEQVHTQCTPADPMGRAIDYAYKLWPRLRRYALDGRYNIDNNPVERTQRPTVMGRKNYLFSKNDSGAVDNAIFYSLIESCDIVGINPLDWLIHVLGNLRDDMTPEQIKQMTPYYYKKSCE